jgi:hypothetical protein
MGFENDLRLATFAHSPPEGASEGLDFLRCLAAAGLLGDAEDRRRSPPGKSTRAASFGSARTSRRIMTMKYVILLLVICAT